MTEAPDLTGQTVGGGVGAATGVFERNSPRITFTRMYPMIAHGTTTHSPTITQVMLPSRVDAL